MLTRRNVGVELLIHVVEDVASSHLMGMSRSFTFAVNTNGDGLASKG